MEERVNSIMRVLVWPNPEKDQVRGVTTQIHRWLERHKVDMLVPKDLADAIGCPEFGKTWDDIRSDVVSWIIVLGGDGSLLRAAKHVAQLDSPILGVNLGHLGFLTEVEVPDLYAALAAILRNEFEVDERHFLQARVVRNGEELSAFPVMNDVVISKGPFARLIHVETFVNEAYVATYPADGLIVATPTGSTAYSLSAGGPVLSPDLNVMVLTPICPHSFFDRSIVIDTKSTVRIRVRTNHRDTLVTIDGQEVYPLMDGDEVVVHASPTTIRLIRRLDWSFFHVLRGWRKGH